MSSRHIGVASRGSLLKFLAASPLVAQRALAEGLRSSDPMEWAPRELDKLITDPKQALDVFDFEPVMRKSVPPAHFGYVATGVNDEVTLRANREAFRKFELRPRRLVDVSNIDMSADILGSRYDSPIVIAPTGSNRAFHEEGERAVARAAKVGNHLQILSTVASTSIEDAITERGEPVWFQLYTTELGGGREAGEARRGSGRAGDRRDARCQVTREMGTFVRLRREDNRQCGSCHGANAYLSSKPNFSGIDVSDIKSGTIVTNLT
jgi:4-hydroxymandelate oxidase